MQLIVNQFFINFRKVPQYADRSVIRFITFFSFIYRYYISTIKYLRKLINIYTIVKQIKLAKISAFILIILVRISFNWQVLCTLIPLIAFAFNAKSFGIAFLVFFFFPSRHFFQTDCQKLFRQRFMISYQESVGPRSDSFLGHSKVFP